MYGNGSSHMLKICLLKEMRKMFANLYEVILRKRIIHAMVETSNYKMMR